MHIEYKDIKLLRQEELQNLFVSVGWVAGQYPEKLVVAMQNSSSVFSAWADDRLIGLINVLDDNVMTAYIHFLLVNPAYQGMGIGKELLRMVTETYHNYLRIVLISDEAETEFYISNGFHTGAGTVAMFIDSF